MDMPDVVKTAFDGWMRRHKMSISTASKALGVSRTSVAKWRTVEPPRYILLACAAYSVGLEPVRK